jgi:hypothetical protein
LLSLNDAIKQEWKFLRIMEVNISFIILDSDI